MTNHHNIIVVGFGSAACAAALNASLLGYSVLILAGRTQKKTESIRPSESLHPGILSLLNHLKCGEMPSDCIRGTYKHILTNGKNFALGEDDEGLWQGMHIDKQKFLYFLRDRTVRAKNINIVYKKADQLIFDDNKIIGVKTNDEFEFVCDYIIDCSGRFHFAANELGLKKNNFSPDLVCWSGVTKNISSEIHKKIITSFYSNGWSWTWLAPENDDMCTWTRLCLKGESDFKPPKLLEAFQNESLAIFNMKWHMYSPLAIRGLLVCGDAGAIIDPAAGQGIFFSILSAIASTETIDKCLKDKMNEIKFLKEYDKWFAGQFTSKLRRLRSYYESNS